uniref:Alpha beta hydrolase fold protein n=1 Tax=Colletotrichum fructicola (strain Nara gc5) TaxID=1213859 RepID=L2GEA8_COLFN
MGIFDFRLSYQWLFWTAPTGEPPAAPEGLTRYWVETPSGRIEVLSNQSETPNTSKTPIVFVHGGMGSAWVWTEYMRYLGKHDIPCYAVSLRGHGNSWHPSYLKMVYFTTRQNLADDAIAVIRWVRERQGSEVLLVGHSSGGGLSQGILSAQQARVKGVALLGAVPAFGSHGVYANWAMFDPWFAVRMLFHGWHPNSPLSHPFLHDEAFRQGRRHSGWGTSTRILILTGTQDKLMTHGVMQKLAGTFRHAFAQLVGEKKLDAKVDTVNSTGSEGSEDDEGCGVRLAWIHGAGHHLQNDVMWEVGAKKLLDFYEQL